MILHTVHVYVGRPVKNNCSSVHEELDFTTFYFLETNMRAYYWRLTNRDVLEKYSISNRATYGRLVRYYAVFHR